MGEDPVGDVLVAGEVPAVATGGAADLVRLAYDLREGAIVFDLSVADLSADTPAADSTGLVLRFEYAEQPYAVVVTRDVLLSPSNEIAYEATLHKIDPETGRALVTKGLDLEVDTASDTLRLPLPTDDIVDVRGVPLIDGGLIEGIWVQGQHVQEWNRPEEEGRILYEDRLPDDGWLDLVIDRPAADNLVVVQGRPDTLASNGEAGILMFPIEAFNTDDRAVDVSLAVSAAPPGWDAWLPEARFTVAPGDTETRWLAVNVPGQHEHGDDGVIHVTGVAGGADVQLNFTVLFTEVPQPAGHHPRLYFHSSSETPSASDQAQAPLGYSTAGIYMNADPEDAADSDEPVSLHGTSEGYGWRIPLSPSLALSLDFEPEQLAVASYLLEAPGPYSYESVSAHARLLIASADGETLLGEGPVQELGPLGEQAVESPLILAAVSDLVRYSPGSNLILEINIDSDDPLFDAGLAPINLLPGGTLDLPLVDFVDPEALGRGRFSIAPAGDEPFPVSPAGSVVPIVISNDGVEAAAASVNIRGLADGWTAVPDARLLNIAAGGAATVDVHVGPGGAASAGTQAVFVVEVSDDHGGQDLLPITVVVDEDAAAVATSEEASIQIGPLLVIGLTFMTRHERMRREGL